MHYNPILLEKNMFACVQREIPGIFISKVLTGVCNHKNNSPLEISPMHEEFLHGGGGPPVPGSVLRGDGEQLLTVHALIRHDFDGVIRARLTHVNSHTFIPLICLFLQIFPQGYTARRCPFKK